MQSGDRFSLDQLQEHGRMRWSEGAQGWRAEPDEVVSALAASGFEECKREIARTPPAGQVAGGVWQGVDHRTGAVASTIWVCESLSDFPLVFIEIDGRPIRGV
jgi:hypothetical protein